MVNSQSLFKSNDDIYRTCDNSIHSNSHGHSLGEWAWSAGNGGMKRIEIIYSLSLR